MQMDAYEKNEGSMGVLIHIYILCIYIYIYGQVGFRVSFCWLSQV